MFKKILVPADQSDCALNASKVAIDLASRCGAIVHFYHHNSVSDPDSSVNVFKKLSEIKGFDAINHSSSSSDGNLTENILSLIEQHGADLLVMGTHGMEGFNKVFIGSNTQKLVRLSPIPVLAIKNIPEDAEFNDIVFASDFKEEAKSAFKIAVSFASLFDAKIHLLHVNTLSFLASPQSMVKTSIEEFMKMCPEGKFEVHSTVSFNVEEGIQRFIEETGADLVCIATHGRKGFGRLLRGSIAEEVVNYLDLPVLTMGID